MRMYLPRSYSELLENYDVIHIAGAAGVRNFRPDWLKWKEGRGLLMSGGSEAFGARGNDPSWDPSPVDNALC